MRRKNRASSYNDIDILPSSRSAGTGPGHHGGKTSSGITVSWRLWRHCCCRYGWYPLLIAPIISAGCFLSLYSAGGCDFVRVNVGFTPSNDSWNSSTAELGLFFYQSGIKDKNKYRAAFLDGCRQYTDDFTDEFIQDDRTWKVARVRFRVCVWNVIHSFIHSSFIHSL